MTILSGLIDNNNADGYDVTLANIHVTVALGATIVTNSIKVGIDMGNFGDDNVVNNGSISSGEGIVGIGTHDYI